MAGMGDADRGGELERVLATHADGLDAADGIADAMPRPDELAARLQSASRLQAAVRGLPPALLKAALGETP
jgi:hypothetical protein